MVYKSQRIHFIGIGGIGMSGIAQVLLELGYEVTGSDIRSGPTTRRLAAMGAAVRIGHRASNIEGADVVVFSSAISQDNPELRAARAAGIPVIPRAEMLGELMRLKRYGIAVAGAHGKTSTTSMIAAVMQGADMDPTVVIGGRVNGLGSNARWGRGEFLVAEADESDGSFLCLSPTIAVVTNIDLEHLDFYSDLEAISRRFRLFCRKVPFYGAVIACGDDPVVRETLKELGKRVITYGTGAGVELRATDIALRDMAMEYTAWWRGEPLGRVRLGAPGVHHVQNSLAAVAVGLEIGLEFSQIARGLEEYRGVQRRFHLYGQVDGVVVMDDYAHHPTEIRATLKTARACWPEARLLVLFEPHRYTRTRALLHQFPGAFEEADLLWISDIYPASEEPIPGVDGRLLAETVRRGVAGRVRYLPTVGEMAQAALAEARPGDVIITMGAGSIGRLAPELVEGLRARSAAAAG